MIASIPVDIRIHEMLCSQQNGITTVYLPRTNRNTHKLQHIHQLLREQQFDHHAKIAKEDIRMMRNDVGSQVMFNALVTIVREEWSRRGETAFAEGFSKEYFVEPSLECQLISRSLCKSYRESNSRGFSSY